MLPLLQENRKPTFSERINSGMQQGMESAMTGLDKYQQHQEKQKQNEAIEKFIGPEARNMPREFQDLMIRADIQKRHDELKYGRAKDQAKKSANVNYSDHPPSTTSTETKTGKKGLLDIEAGEKPKKTKDLSLNARNQERGIAPENQTEGNVFRLNNPDEIEAKGVRIAQDRNDQGIPTTKDEGIAIATNQEIVKQNFNANQNADKNAQHTHDITQGNRAIDKLNNVFGPEGTTDEMKAFAAKRGQELSREYTNQADIDRAVSKDMTQLKNTVNNLKKAKKPARIFQKGYRKLLGTDRENDAIIKDIQIKVQPLLDLGFNDTARKILKDDLEMYPEEIEATITSLSEKARKNLSNLPMVGRTQPERQSSGKNKSDILSDLPRMKSAKEIKGEKPFYLQQSEVFEPELNYTPEQKEVFKNNIIDTLKANPSENLILLRKEVEDKNYDWKLFKDTLDDAIFNGEIILDEDQFLNQFDYLNEPPEDRLDYLLSTFGFGSR